MGAVYLATRDDAQYRKQVAIKVVKRGMDTDAMLERFVQERQILASLEHPYIARLLDAGVTGDGRPYLVMDYVEGLRIDAYCTQNCLTSPQICRLFLKVCEAVSYAHRNLVVHRDLKPSNIYVSPDGSPKLLDFGIAKLLTGGDETILLTAASHRPLTPEYSSPEHIRGLAVNTATDIYSLGCILYELLTGQRAFSFPAQTPSTWERIAAEQEPPKPSTHRPHLKGDLENILLMALRKEPARRYSSVEQFAADIERFLTYRPVAARKDSFSYRAGKFVRRNRLGIAAGALIAASLIGGAILSLYQAHRAGLARDAADHELASIVALVNRTLFDVHDDVETLPGGMEVGNHIVATTLEYLQQLRTTAGDDDGVRFVLGAAYFKTAMLQGPTGHATTGDITGALQSIAHAEDAFRPLLLKKPNDQTLIEAWVDVESVKTDILAKTPRQSEIVPVLRAVLPYAIRSTQLSPVDWREAQVRQRLARALSVSDPDESLRQVQLGAQVLTRVSQRNPNEVNAIQALAVQQSDWAATLLGMGRMDQAMAHNREALRIREMLVARDPSNSYNRRSLMITYGRVAGLLADSPPLGRLNPPGIQAGRAYYQKALAMAHQLLAADPTNKIALHDLASANLRLGALPPLPGKSAESLQLLGQGKEQFQQLVRADPANTDHQRNLALACEVLGNRLLGQGNPAAATMEFRTSLNLAGRLLAADPNNIPAAAAAARSQMGEARALAAMRQPAAAVQEASRSLAATQAVNTRVHTFASNLSLGMAEIAIAQVHLKLARWTDAARYAQSAVDQFSSMNQQRKNSASAELALAQSLLAQADRHSVLSQTAG